MICPYCDSRIENLPNNYICPQCSAPLADYLETQAVRRQKLVFPDPPIGKYKQMFGHMKIEERCVRLYSKPPLNPGIEWVFPYNEIAAVEYRPGDAVKGGYLSIRGWQDRHHPFPVDAYEASYDRKSFCFTIWNNEKYQRIYLFLAGCAEAVNTVGFENEEVLRQSQSDVAASIPLLTRCTESLGHMEFAEDAVNIYKDQSYEVPKMRKILYSEIAEVFYSEAGDYKRGCLCIREWRERKDMQKTIKHIALDMGSIAFFAADNEKMRQAYFVLKEIVKINNIRWENNGRNQLG